MVAISEEGPAVGRDGGPANRWDTVEDTELGHSEYWSSGLVSRAIVARLSVAPQRYPQERRLRNDAGLRGAGPSVTMTCQSTSFQCA